MDKFLIISEADMITTQAKFLPYRIGVRFVARNKNCSGRWRNGRIIFASPMPRCILISSIFIQDLFLSPVFTSARCTQKRATVHYVKIPTTTPKITVCRSRNRRKWRIDEKKFMETYPHSASPPPFSLSLSLSLSLSSWWKGVHWWISVFFLLYR